MPYVGVVKEKPTNTPDSVGHTGPNLQIFGFRLAFVHHLYGLIIHLTYSFLEKPRESGYTLHFFTAPRFQTNRREYE